MLARHYAAERQVGARCKTESRLWEAAEASWLDARSSAEATLAAAPAMALCAVCPMVAACHEWAQTDRYTGLAAGTGWIRGKARLVKFGRTPAPIQRAS